MLGFLLFAGVLNIDLSLVRERKWEIGLLAIGGTVISTFLIGTVLYGVLSYLHINLNYPQCLLFGALISPTDPVAVLAIFKNIHSLKPLATTLSAESLYNDGIGVVLFVTIYAVAFNSGHPTATSSIVLFLRQAIGGLAAGVLLGALACWLMKPIKDYKMKTLISVATVVGGYTATQHTGLSGLLAMVTAGIIVGNYRRDIIMT
jgi:CPA1 family monovalent cation:H+ antiporter